MYALLAIIPIILAVVLMTGFHVKSGSAMLWAWVTAIAIAFIFWKMEIRHVAAYSLMGAVSSVDTMLILFGAIFLLNTMIRVGYIKAIGDGFKGITHDRRIQILIIGWLFGCFLEGAAGFGTPAALAAPLLVGLGIPPFPAALASLLGNGAPTCFGAVGTPPIAGFTSVLASIRETFPGVDPQAYAAQLYSRMALTNIFTGTFLPVLIMATVVFQSGGKRRLRDMAEILPLSVFSGLVFTIPVYFIATYIGPEIPSLLGALIGLAIMILAVKAGFLVPRYVWRFPGDSIVETVPDEPKGVPVLLAWTPYAIIAAVLVVTRLPWLPIKGWIDGTLVRVHGFLGVEGIDYSWKIFNNAGIFPFALVALAYMIANRCKGDEICKIGVATFRQIANATVALVAGVALVQIMRYTNFSNPTAELASMATEVAKALASLFGKVYPLISPAVGVFGAFVSGSNTVSNIMFAALQFKIAVLVGLPTVLVVMCQSMGGAVGCMICINNVVAVSATTGAEGSEGKLILAAMWPCVVYSLMVSAAAFVFLAIDMHWIA